MTSVAFDRAADYYDETRGFPAGVEKQAAALIAEVGNFDTRTRLLEIGIGTGRIALPLAPHVKAIYGIDLARPMMAKLRSKQTSQEVIHLVEGSADHLPYPSGVFQGAVAVHVLHLIPTWRQVLEALARVLGKHGVFVHGWGDHQPDDLWTIWNREFSSQQVKGISKAQYDAFLQEAGWQKVGERKTIAYQRMLVPSSLIQRIQNRISSSMWEMTDEQIAEGVKHMQKLIQERYSNPEAPVEITHSFSAEAYLPPQL